MQVLSQPSSAWDVLAKALDEDSREGASKDPQQELDGDGMWDILRPVSCLVAYT